MCIRLYFYLWDIIRSPWDWFIVWVYECFSAWLSFVSAFLNFPHQLLGLTCLSLLTDALGYHSLLPQVFFSNHWYIGHSLGSCHWEVLYICLLDFNSTSSPSSFPRYQEVGGVGNWTFQHLITWLCWLKQKMYSLVVENYVFFGGQNWELKPGTQPLRYLWGTALNR